MKDGKECGMCNHWLVNDRCAHNSGEIYSTDVICNLFDPEGNNELEVLQGHIQRKEREVEQLQKRHRELTGRRHVYFK